MTHAQLCQDIVTSIRQDSVTISDEQALIDITAAAGLAAMLSLSPTEYLRLAERAFKEMGRRKLAASVHAVRMNLIMEDE